VSDRGIPKWHKYGKQARRLFVERGYSIPEIHRALQGAVSETTLYKWMTADNWRQRREAYEGSVDHAILTLKTKRLELIGELESKAPMETVALADTLSKLDKVLERIEGSRDPLRETIDVLDGFVTWLESQDDRDGLKALHECFGGYIDHVARTMR